MKTELSREVIVQTKLEVGKKRGDCLELVTMAPIVLNGRNCLVCHDVEGAECVRLKAVTLYYIGTPWQRVTRESDDIFELVENDIFSWPALDQILEAQFLVRLKDGKSWWIRVRSGGVVKNAGDAGWEHEREWLDKRGFLGRRANV